MIKIKKRRGNMKRNKILASILLSMVAALFLVYPEITYAQEIRTEDNSCTSINQQRPAGLIVSAPATVSPGKTFSVRISGLPSMKNTEVTAYVFSVSDWSAINPIPPTALVFKGTGKGTLSGSLKFQVSKKATPKMVSIGIRFDCKLLGIIKRDYWNWVDTVNVKITK
jgi:hypothetical protein